MTHYKVSAAITVWKTKTQDIIFPTAGAIKHVDYTSQEVWTLCNGYLRVCYVKPGNLSDCIPEGHSLYSQFTGPFPFFVKVAGSGL